MTMSSSSKSSNNDKTCCIFIGSTGCGKSTLIEIMSSDGIKRSGSSDTSYTKSIGVTKHKSNSNLLLMDTIGCEDTDDKMSDEEILKEITHKLAQNGALYIKVIWCTKPEDRKKPPLQKQAKFINSLVNGEWGAVQVIVKKGGDETDSNGAKGAIKNHNKDIGVSIFDLHCLDRIPNVKKNFMYEYVMKKDFDERLKGGFLHDNEINGVITDKINKLKKVKAELKKEFYHKKSGRLLTKRTHKGSIETKYKHSGYVEEYVTSSETTCPYGHSVSDIEYCYYVFKSLVSYWECDRCGKSIKVGDNFYHCFGCCDRSGHNQRSKTDCSIVIKCAGMYCTGCGKSGTRESKSTRMSCCKKSMSSFIGFSSLHGGCTIDYKGWSGCGCREGALGCMEEYKYWSCCNASEYQTLNSICGDWKWVPKN